MLEVKSFSILLKNGVHISIFAEEYELYETEDFKAYNFMINENLVSIIDYDSVDNIVISGATTLFVTNKY